VLRVAGWIQPRQIVTGATALRAAEEYGLPAPRLIAADLEGRVTGVPATLETALPGTRAMPAKASAERLREVGAAIAKVHAIPLDPRPDLPLRVRPRTYDYALGRRWATLYRATADSDKALVVDALCELTGWPADRGLHAVTSTRTTPLLQLADDRIRELDRPQGPTVLVHGDPWAGNMIWDGDTCLALIDWKAAGAGDPGVDLGALRLQMALQYGPDAPGHVLDGWQHQSGREATDVAYWDAVAGVTTPTEIDRLPSFDDRGRPLDASAVTARRDAFLRAALDRLERHEPPHQLMR
jgi:aminoglycoside phosphotransferase (APT) family kinase protein